MARKLFIVDAGNERLYSALRSALANEPDVQIFYDRRHRSAAAWRGEERRAPSDVQDRIRADGFAVVRPDSQPPAAGNVRWA
jgi:hypothetical protein